VGANESGKSHLLTAIEKGISGQGIESHDFCRYSQYFTVTKGEMRSPDFGFEWAGLSSAEKAHIRELCELASTLDFESFLVFRTNTAQLDAFLPNGSTFSHFQILPEKLTNFLPSTFRINADIALPDSVSIRELAQDAINGTPARFEGLEREQRFSAIEGLQDIWDIRNGSPRSKQLHNLRKMFTPCSILSPLHLSGQIKIGRKSGNARCAGGCLRVT